MMKSFTFHNPFSHTPPKPVTGKGINPEPGSSEPQPGSWMVGAIMNYSRALYVQKSEIMGHVLVMMN